MVEVVVIADIVFVIVVVVLVVLSGVFRNLRRGGHIQYMEPEDISPPSGVQRESPSPQKLSDYLQFKLTHVSAIQ